jgi:hypothetical protein
MSYNTLTLSNGVEQSGVSGVFYRIGPIHLVVYKDEYQ